MGASGSSEDKSETWPPDWDALPAEKRQLARAAILSLSERPPEEFLTIAKAAHVITPAEWKFEEYHAAAAAAVQEDIKLNKLVYKLVPRKLTESDFWRLYFSEVLFVLDSVKAHGQYPPPPPPPPKPTKESDAAAKKKKARPAPQPEESESYCVMIFEAERQRWQAERRMLLEDSASVRHAADETERLLSCWSTLAHDLLFFGLFVGRRQQWIDKLTTYLSRSLGEVEGVLDLEITELRLPPNAELAPRVALVRYAGPELSEWRVTWDPPSAQAGGSIALKGRRFGVSFTIVVAVGSLSLSGLLVCRYTPEEAQPKLHVGFKRPPNVHFDVSIAGKALSLGSETLRAWLQRQLDQALREHLVLPRTVSIPLPFLRGSAGGTPLATAALAPAATPAGATIVGGPAATQPSPSSPASSLLPSMALPDFDLFFATPPAERGTAGAPAASPASEAASQEEAALRRLLGLREESYTGPTWLLDARLAELLGVPLPVLERRRPVLEASGEIAEPRDWATSLVIALLQLRYHDRISMWGSLIEVRRHAFPRALMRAAMETVCELVAVHHQMSAAVIADERVPPPPRAAPPAMALPEEAEQRLLKLSSEC